jgi:hypothetical protein
MLLHIRPRLFSPFHVELVDMEIKTLNLCLKGGVDLTTRRPYRNKHYAVACRCEGRKAIDGIFIETSGAVQEMHYTARWAIQGAFVAIHEVYYTLLDGEHDAASDNMVLWYACDPKFGDRWPVWARDLAPVDAEPRMEVVPSRTTDRPKKPGYADDVRDEQLGWIVRRRQTFPMPTLERERILSRKFEPRQPLLSSTFPAK